MFHTNHQCLSASLQMPGNRRQFLQTTAAGFGWLAFSSLATRQALADFSNPLAPRESHFTPRAKRVIFLYMQGAPSHLDTFDWKPELKQLDGKTADGSGKGRKLLGPVFPFKASGQSGLMISELFPHLSQHADKMCILNGCKTTVPAHPQATVMLNTGSTSQIRPSLGAWTVYGMGTENQDLPGFASIMVKSNLSAQNYGAAFLPAAYQGTRIDAESTKIANIQNSRLNLDEQRHQIDFIQGLNRNLAGQYPSNSELEGVIQSYELGYRMQTAVPETMDVSREPKHVQESYGIDQQETKSFGRACLMARRMAEAGVRFIQVTTGGWDHHNDLHKRLKSSTEQIDKPIAALLGDLESKGLLKDTLVIWGGEFGRGSYDQGDKKDGRPHNNRGYSMWMAGGGVKGGMRYGATDPLGSDAVEGIVDTHDFHATILHLLGFDHLKLTYRYAGRDFRLTDVYGNVVKDIIA